MGRLIRNRKGRHRQANHAQHRSAAKDRRLIGMPAAPEGRVSRPIGLPRPICVFLWLCCRVVFLPVVSDRCVSGTARFGLNAQCTPIDIEQGFLFLHFRRFKLA